MSEEYIKRADVVKLLDDTWVDGTEYMGYLHGDLEKIQTTDVVEVVRCKDCLHGEYCEDVLWCNITDEPMCEDDYCSYGERKEE